MVFEGRALGGDEFMRWSPHGFVSALMKDTQSALLLLLSEGDRL